MYYYSDLVRKISGAYRIVGNTSFVSFDNALPIFSANERSIVWLSDDRKDGRELIVNTPARTVVLSDRADVDKEQLRDKCFVIVENPKLVFQRIVGEFFQNRRLDGIHVNAFLHKEAHISSNAYVGAYTYVGRCDIGRNVTIHSNCSIYDGVVIGDDVVIHSGTVIGSVGFGLTRNELQELENFPHIGGVIIGSNVEIGANACIDRGALGDTVIGFGSKIDNLVHIAHNVQIGKHTAIVANCLIAGSSKIGDYCWLGPSVTVRDRITIGDRTKIGMGAVVTRSVGEDQTWMGSPAMPLDEFLAIRERIKRL